MTQPNTAASLSADLVSLGLRPAMTVMVHSSLGRVGWIKDGPVTVIGVLLDLLGPHGTLVMPAESPQFADPANTQSFDPFTTPATMGAIPYEGPGTPLEKL